MSHFAGVIARWQSSQGTTEDLRRMLIEAGWTPPITQPDALDGPIQKLQHRQQHHSRIAAMDEEYAESAGDREEEETYKAKARERRTKAANYEYAANLLRALRQSGRRARS